MTKQMAGIGLLIFGVGVVSGMIAQRLIAPEPDPEPVAETQVASMPSGPRYDEAMPERRRETRATRDFSPEMFEMMSGPSAATEPPREARPPAEPPPTNAPRENRDREEFPWGREMWTNREAWIAQRLAEREERIERMRSNLVEQAKLNEQQEVRFEVLIAAMNLRLREQAALWREAIESGAMSRPEARARAMKEIGSAISLTYDELDRNMPPNWRTATTNESINLWTFIDPELWRDMRPLMGRGRPPTPPSGSPDSPGR